MGNNGVNVVATTTLILYFEEAAAALAMPYLETDEVTVGTHVCVDHLAPAQTGKPITVRAQLLRQQGRRLEFSMEARQEQALVMKGEHHRAVADSSKFAGEPASSSRRLDFWFDFHSPWCYFASHRIADLARRHRLELSWKPVHLANLMQAVDGRRPLESNDNFLAWYQQDKRDTAEVLELPFNPHPDYPLRPSRALRAAIFAAENNRAESFVQKVMRGYWSDESDISDMEWLAATAEACGLDGSAIESIVSSETYKNKLNQNLADGLAVFVGLVGHQVASQPV